MCSVVLRAMGIIVHKDQVNTTLLREMGIIVHTDQVNTAYCEPPISLTPFQTNLHTRIDYTNV